MAVFAIADLHLAFSVDKPMDRFGPQWVGHPEKIARAWRAAVGPQDTVLVAGDTSWAMRLDEARADLQYLADLPGRKLLLRGNHDYWWGSLAKVRAALPSGIEVLQHDAHQVEDCWVAGARGWLLPDPQRTASDRAIYERELGRLRLSLEATGPNGRRLAMLHYPPWLPGIESTAVRDLLQEFGVEICVYGHLHAMAKGTYPDGVYDGMQVHCVSADLVDFAPRRIL
jgi:predicted phosphohydrolase